MMGYKRNGNKLGYYSKRNTVTAKKSIKVKSKQYDK